MASPALTALEKELESSTDTIVWIDRAGLLPKGENEVRVVPETVSARSGRGEMYGRGLELARSDVIAFIDSSTVVQAGWRQALATACENGGRIMGGPLSPSLPRSMKSWAGFLVDYGVHAVSPFTSASGDVAGNNVAYVRSELNGLTTMPFFKTSVNRWLARREVQPVMVEGMRAVVTKTYGWRALTSDRFRHGREYSAQRRVEMGVVARLLRAGAGLGLPALLGLRLATRVLHDSKLGRHLLAAAPLVLAALMCWSAGEAAGYLIDDKGSRALY
jgi:hypothetical protein